jgi:hypothetical protein
VDQRRTSNGEDPAQETTEGEEEKVIEWICLIALILCSLFACLTLIFR